MAIRRIPSGQNGKSSGPARAGRPNTINLEQRALDDLLNELDDSPGNTEASKRRDFIRWPFRQTSVSMRVVQGRGIETELEVACRNLSCGGASVLHSSFLHTGSRVTLRLPVADGGVELAEGTICRCNHVRGVVHEIGIRFTRSVEVRRFLPSSTQTHHFSLERVDPEKLQGTVVHLDDSPMDRRLVQHYMRGTQVRLRQTDDGEEAIRWITESCDLAMIDVDLGPERPSGLSVVKRLREGSCPVPIVLLTADSGARLIADPALRVEASLVKPVTQDVVLRAIAEFILLGAGTGPMYTTLSGDHPNLVLLDGFLSDVRSSAASLKAAMASEDFAKCRSISAGIMGTAPAMGFASLGSAAERAVDSLTTTGSVGSAMGPLQSLLGACDRVRTGRAAA